MYQKKTPVSAKETLPTMYDLKSEDIEEPGVPDEFHLFQPQLLSLTFCPPNYGENQVFNASDLNLYYDVNHTQWYKRPDWFGVVGVSRLYDETELRLSYVIWQEEVTPLIVVELLSPGTESEDLGRNLRSTNQPPTKWEVYEQILKIPYYVIYNRYTNDLQAFGLVNQSYQLLLLPDSKLWLESAQLGLGIWTGEYRGITRQWLRWYGAQQNWILTPEEKASQQAEYQRQQAEAERKRAEYERQQAEAERKRAEYERQQAEYQRQQAEAERKRATELEALLQQYQARFGDLTEDN